VLIAVLGGIFVFTAVAAHHDDPVTPGGIPAVMTPQAEYPIGRCIDVLPGPTKDSGPVAQSVPCEGRNSGKLSSIVDYPRPCPPDTNKVDLVLEQVSLCLVSP
jgi:hypothetical protein